MLPSSAIEIAQALVRLPSVNPDYDLASPAEREVAKWIEAWGRGHGFDVLRQPVVEGGRDNIFLTLRNGADHPHLQLNGHMDTVAVKGMTIDPFGGEVRDDRLWGRGSSDMKGPLAAMLAAALDLKESPDSWQGTLTIACVVDEETRFRGVQAMMAGGVTLPDLAIVGEPTGLRVVRGCKGVLRFGVVVTGKSAHSSKPKEGLNAILVMGQVMVALQHYFDDQLAADPHPDFGPVTGSIGMIEGGTGVNIVPERCRIEVDVRVLPGQKPEEVYAGIQEWVRGMVKLPDGAGLVFEDPFLLDIAFELPGDHDFVQAACEALGESTSEVAFYSCDGSKIAAGSIPTLVIGPGSIAQAHTANEFIALSDLEAGVEAYVKLARKVMPSAG